MRESSFQSEAFTHFDAPGSPVIKEGIGSDPESRLGVRVQGQDVKFIEIHAHQEIGLHGP